MHEKHEETLLRERQRTIEALRRVDEEALIATEADGDLTTWQQHPADEGTDTMEQEKALMLLGKEGELLTQIDHALRKLYREPESFGVCEQCGARIDEQRLELVPWARLCTACQKAEESGG